MFDISLAELALIVAVAVIFIKPEDVPVVLRACAKAFAGVKALGREMQEAFSDLAKESGLEEAHKNLSREMKMIQGEDGKMYEAYNLDDFLHPSVPIKPSLRAERPVRRSLGEGGSNPSLPQDKPWIAAKATPPRNDESQ